MDLYNISNNIREDIKNHFMLPLPYSQRFCIDNFISGCTSLNWIDMFVKCQTTATLTENTTIPSKFKNIEDMRLSFSRFANHLCFIITRNNKAVIPDGMSAENFLKVKPIIERLVSEQELKKDWLTLYEKTHV